jgi:hypothetical protein
MFSHRAGNSCDPGMPLTELAKSRLNSTKLLMWKSIWLSLFPVLHLSLYLKHFDIFQENPGFFHTLHINFFRLWGRLDLLGRMKWLCPALTCNTCHKNNALLYFIRPVLFCMTPTIPSKMKNQSWSKHKSHNTSKYGSHFKMYVSTSTSH